MESTLLITGGTGLFGSTLIEYYLQHEPDTNIVALVRGRNPDIVAERLYSVLRKSPTLAPALSGVLTGRVKVLPGDFAQNDLGLPSPELSHLTQSVTDIVHSGASVDFGLPLPDARVINVDGTKNMIDFALRCRQLQCFLHISTGHVAGKRSGTIMEDELGTAQGFFNSYEQTKAEAELLVQEHMDAIPAAIHRLTTVIGDHATGHIRQFGFFHNSIRLLSQGTISFLAGDRNGHLDLIPTEYPVQAVHHLHKRHFNPGTTYHICCGPERSFTLEAFLNETAEYFKKRLNNKDLEPPAIVSPEEFDQRVARSNSARVTAVLHALGTFIGHLTLPKVFDQTNAIRDCAGSGIEAPPVRAYYFKVLDECVERKFGKK